MTKHLELTVGEWNDIRTKIREEFGDSMILLRDKMRRELGFTPRVYTQWVDRDVHPRDVGFRTAYPREMVHIDFYDESARTWFLLKFI
jgi:hypothetical protein